jgi:hypothetical protein
MFSSLAVPLWVGGTGICWGCLNPTCSGYAACHIRILMTNISKHQSSIRLSGVVSGCKLKAKVRMVVQAVGYNCRSGRAAEVLHEIFERPQSIDINT